MSDTEDEQNDGYDQNQRNNKRKRSDTDDDDDDTSQRPTSTKALKSDNEDSPVWFNNNNPQGFDCSNDLDTIDDDAEFVVMFSNGNRCHGLESAAWMIISRGIGENVYSENDARAYNVKAGTPRYTMEEVKRVEQLLETAAAKPRTNPQEPDWADLLSKLREKMKLRLTPKIMEDLLKLGQILQNVGPEWDDIVETWPQDLQDEWDLVKGESTLYEPPHSMSNELKSVFEESKQRAWGEWLIGKYFGEYSAEQRAELEKLIPSLTEENLRTCGLGGECIKVASTVLLSAYNGWAERNGLPVYNYEAEAGQITQGTWQDPLLRQVIAAYALGQRDFYDEDARRGLDLSQIDGNELNPDNESLVLPGITLDGVSFADSEFVSANFSYAVLTNADLRGANFNDSEFISTNFDGSDLTEASFEGATMSQADLSNIVKIVDPNDEYDVDIDANFNEAYLVGANAYSGSLRGSTFNGATLRGVTMEEVDLVGASFRGADLHGAMLIKCDLINAVFTRDTKDEITNLSGITLTESDCRYAKFVDAIMTSAVCIGTDFTGADFDGAMLYSADLSRATMIDAVLDDSSIHLTKLHGLDGTRFSFTKYGTPETDLEMWANDDGFLHREDGPAMIHHKPGKPDIIKRWFRNGVEYTPSS